MRFSSPSGRDRHPLAPFTVAEQEERRTGAAAFAAVQNMGRRRTAMYAAARSAERALRSAGASPEAEAAIARMHQVVDCATDLTPAAIDAIRAVADLVLVTR